MELTWPKSLAACAARLLTQLSTVGVRPARFNPAANWPAARTVGMKQSIPVSPSWPEQPPDFSGYPRRRKEEQPMQFIKTLSDHKTGALPADFSRPVRRRLTELPPGSYARMVEFDPDIPSEYKAHLQAYGVIPGHALRLRQHKPVTVIQVEHTELAFEANLADAIFVVGIDAADAKEV
jgi:Fe2+ transport system protein FeoA